MYGQAEALIQTVNCIKTLKYPVPLVFAFEGIF